MAPAGAQVPANCLPGTGHRPRFQPPAPSRCPCTLWLLLHCLEHDILRALPQHTLAHRPQPLAALDDGEEVIPRELSQLAGKARRPVGEQDLRLTVAARIKQYLPWRRIARRILP